MDLVVLLLNVVVFDFTNQFWLCQPDPLNFPVKHSSQSTSPLVEKSFVRYIQLLILLIEIATRRILLVVRSMKHAYRKQSMQPSTLDPHSKSVLDAYYRRPLFDAEQWQKRAAARPITREHRSPGMEFMSSASRMNPSSQHYGRLQGSSATASYDHPANFNYAQYEVDEYKRQQMRRAQSRTEILIQEEMDRAAKLVPQYVTSPLKRTKRTSKRRGRRKGGGGSLLERVNQLGRMDKLNQATNHPGNPGNPGNDDVATAKQVEQQRRLNTVRMKKRQQRLNAMAKPPRKKIEAAKLFRQKIRNQRKSPSTVLPPTAEGSATTMSQNTIEWIAKSSKAKAAKLEALDEFQQRLKQSKLSPKYSNRDRFNRIRPATVASPLREAWMRSASTPKRIATPYNTASIIGNGAFGCTGSRLPTRSEFELDIGPGDYGIVDDPRTVTNTGACKFNLSQTKTTIEQAIYEKRGVPGPGKYGICDDPRSLQSAGACKFNLSITKDTIDLAIYAKRDVPGPGKYKDSSHGGSGVNGGVKFSDAVTKSNLDMCIFNANNTPGPSHCK